MARHALKIERSGDAYSTGRRVDGEQAARIVNQRIDRRIVLVRVADGEIGPEDRSDAGILRDTERIRAEQAGRRLVDVVHRDIKGFGGLATGPVIGGNAERIRTVEQLIRRVGQTTLECGIQIGKRAGERERAVRPVRIGEGQAGRRSKCQRAVGGRQTERQRITVSIGHGNRVNGKRCCFVGFHRCFRSGCKCRERSACEYDVVSRMNRGRTVGVQAVQTSLTVRINSVIECTKLRCRRAIILKQVVNRMILIYAINSTGRPEIQTSVDFGEAPRRRIVVKAQNDLRDCIVRDIVAEQLPVSSVVRGLKIERAIEGSQSTRVRRNGTRNYVLDQRNRAILIVPVKFGTIVIQQIGA